MYISARARNMASQMAVSLVVMNRVEDHRFPNTVCGVVKQGIQMVRTQSCFGEMPVQLVL